MTTEAALPRLHASKRLDRAHLYLFGVWWLVAVVGWVTGSDAWLYGLPFLWCAVALIMTNAVRMERTLRRRPLATAPVAPRSAELDAILPPAERLGANGTRLRVFLQRLAELGADEWLHLDAAVRALSRSRFQDPLRRGALVSNALDRAYREDAAGWVGRIDARGALTQALVTMEVQGVIPSDRLPAAVRGEVWNVALGLFVREYLDDASWAQVRTAFVPLFTSDELA